MPQMAPIKWLFLFIMFILTLILYNILNYFFLIKLPSLSMYKSKLLKNSLNWKW
uniref:ATP synthase complex subunit 8 n=1 Tax=Vermiophis taishanensis TaxID=2885621 RepID=A0A8K1KVV3_9DIPT|nr:ATP synthase F0 subunit 8 [Vermiophis taishanensis]